MQLTIEKLVYGGDGLARLPADENGHGKAMFVPFVLPGEEVEAEILETKPGFARGIPETWWYDQDKAAKLERGR